MKAVALVAFAAASFLAVTFFSVATPVNNAVTAHHAKLQQAMAQAE